MIDRNRRQVNGIVLLDKPTGMTSNAALQIVKKLYKANKAGHTGSLDPLASGQLPICLGQATKISGFLLNADKTYRFTCRLGVTTSTGDAEGEIVDSRSVGRIERTEVESVLKRFIGEIRQLPPMYSALKYQGQRLYRLARQGIAVERQPRRVTIYALRLLKLEGDYLQCQVLCSKGTYIRTLAEDIGNTLGYGAHIVELRRIEIEPYAASRMVTLEELQERAEQGLSALDAVLLPVDTAIIRWPAVAVYEDAAYCLHRGQPVLVPRLPSQGYVRLYNEGSFMGVGEILDDGRVTLRRLVKSSTGG